MDSSSSEGGAHVPARTEAPRRGRLHFLDVLRGVAAMAVVVQHFSEVVSVPYSHWSEAVFRPGAYGVELFFIVSGFIIPASIERYGSLRKFWIGRIFRLLPLCWFVTLSALGIHYFLGRYSLSPTFDADPVGTTFANLTMAEYFLQYERILDVTWTLSYELVFYLLISLLFIGRLNTRSVQLSVVATGAIVTLGLFLPGSMISSLTRPATLHELVANKPLLFVGMSTLVVAVLTVSRARSTSHRWGAIGLSLLTIPLLLNQPRDLWFSLCLLAMMFAGTVFYRMFKGSVAPRIGWPTVAFAVITILVTQRTWIAPSMSSFGVLITQTPEMVTFAAAMATFVAFYLLRELRFPRFLTWLGEVSFSIYLVHKVVLHVVPAVPHQVLGVPGRLVSVAIWLSLTFAISTLTYQYIELPFQEWGKRMMRWSDQRRMQRGVRPAGDLSAGSAA